MLVSFEFTCSGLSPGWITILPFHFYFTMKSINRTKGNCIKFAKIKRDIWCFALDHVCAVVV